MFQDRTLRDRIVGGINDEAMQRQLLEIPDLAFDIAKKTAIAMEATSKDSQVLSTPNPNLPSLALTNAVSRDAAVKHKRRNQNTPSCFRCAGENFATHCRHASGICHKCRGKGHLSRVCSGNTVDANAGGQVTPTRRQ